VLARYRGREIDTVSIGARLGALAGASEVLLSQTVDLVAGSGLEFEDRGDHVLKGVPGAWRVFAATPTSDATARPEVSAAGTLCQ
jgi:class 3 adenylate cyclase